MIDLSRQENRLKVIQDLMSENTKARKQWSLRSSEVQGGRLQQYVKEYLEGQYSVDSVREMPIVSSINIQKSVVDKKATIYKKKPTREFSEVSDDQADALNLIYRDMHLDEKLNQSNKNYVYQDQSVGMIVPKNGKLICRILKMHQIDAIADYEDPEKAAGYIISAFDRTDYIQHYYDKKEIDVATSDRGRSVRSSASENENQELADDYQYKKYVEKYIVWSKQYNFMMNGLGEVIDPETGEVSNEVDISSPLAEENIMPFFEVSKDKDFEYFVRPSNSLTDFTIEFNALQSDLHTNIKLNGYAVGVLKAPSELQPQNQIIGASMLLKLPTDDPDKEVSFDFVSPSSNIGEISGAVDQFLNYFITSQGLDADVINSQGSSTTYTSGLDRFIATINRMEAHQDDYDKFRNVEKQIYDIIKAWLRVLDGSGMLDNKYRVGNISDMSEISVEYYKPEMIQTESEMLANFQTKIDLGVMSKVDAIMELRGIEDRDQAKELLEEIKEENMPFTMGTFTPPSETDQDLNFDATVDDDDDEDEELEVQE
jgi:hypothetical protein